MASGVAVDEEVEKMIQKMQMPCSKGGKDERLKLLIMRLNEDDTRIVVDHDCTRCQKDFSSEDDIYKEVMKTFKDDQCCYAVYDCFYQTKEASSKEELVFITWCPDLAPVKQRMLYGSSATGLKSKCPGIKHQLQMNDQSDKDISNLIEKFGTKGAVREVEGKPIH
ncbi:hypothetical protein SKAU_G00179950 [Synaphobranchus kaupii]|uniref:ADF-H domain-containing protein n=1 Tax=Synaphobranchus kaupii TaxID=118154 RepID=A0A9Q1J1K5_SYNKA|nr:hypothetical protein SKAU_G00179950 [Synaphobranchus kaupii]